MFQQLCVAAEKGRVAWGPCWEGVLSDVGDATDMLTNASVDPSPPLPWFDKARLLVHGPLLLKVSRFTVPVDGDDEDVVVVIFYFLLPVYSLNCRVELLG